MSDTILTLEGMLITHKIESAMLNDQYLYVWSVEQDIRNAYKDHGDIMALEHQLEVFYYGDPYSYLVRTLRALNLEITRMSRTIKYLETLKLC